MNKQLSSFCKSFEWSIKYKRVESINLQFKHRSFEKLHESKLNKKKRRNDFQKSLSFDLFSFFSSLFFLKSKSSNWVEDWIELKVVRSSSNKCKCAPTVAIKRTIQKQWLFWWNSTNIHFLSCSSSFNSNSWVVFSFIHFCLQH